MQGNSKAQWGGFLGLLPLVPQAGLLLLGMLGGIYTCSPKMMAVG